MKIANRIVMTLAGAILIVAALLKSHQLLTEPILADGFWESWLFFVIQIPLELALGIWLMSGLFRKAAWLAGLFAFAVFIGVTLFKAIAGWESCGCFGKIHVDPWITFFAVDIPFFLVLAIFRPRGEKLLPPPWPRAEHFWGVALPSAVIIITLTLIIAFNKVPETTERHEVVRPQNWTTVKPPKKPTPPHPNTPTIEPNDIDTPPAQTVEPNLPPPEPNTPAVEPNSVAEPNITQTSQPDINDNADFGDAVDPNAEEFPLLAHIDIAETLRPGISVIFFYHDDCPGCEEMVPKYSELCDEVAGSGDQMRIAFIEVPPYGPDEDDLVPKDTTCTTGRLDTSKTWYLETPLVVITVEGQLVQYWQEDVPHTLEELLEAIYGEF